MYKVSTQKGKKIADRKAENVPPHQRKSDLINVCCL